MSPDERFDRRLREVIQATRSPVPEQQRLARLLDEFRATRAPATRAERIARWLATPWRVPAPAVAFVAALVLIQGLTLLQWLPRDTTPTAATRGDAPPCAGNAAIRVLFKPDAPLGDVVVLLRSLDIGVTAGPSDIGEFWLSLPPGLPASKVLATLGASPLVNEAMQIDPRADCK